MFGDVESGAGSPLAGPDVYLFGVDGVRLVGGLAVAPSAAGGGLGLALAGRF